MKKPYVTIILLLFCWTASLAFWSDKAVATTAAHYWIASTRNDLFNGPFWIYVSWSVVLHSGWSHLLLNTLALTVCGGTLERTWGPLRYGILVIISGLLSSTAQIIWSGHGDIGVSGVVYSCVGALVTAQALHKQFHSRFLLVSTAILSAWLILGIVEGALGKDNIGNASHIVGLFTGVAIQLSGRRYMHLKNH